MKKRSAKNRTLWFAPIAILFVTAAAVFLPKYTKKAMARLPMKVKELHVHGVRALSAIDLKALTGIHEGDPLFGSFASVANGAVEKLQTNPRVDQVSVLRDMTGQVVVRVAERQPVAIVNLDRLYYIDAEGTLLEPVPPHAPEALNLIVITGSWNLPSVKSSEALRLTFSTGLELLRALEKKGFEQKQISEIHFDSKLGWVVYRVGSDASILMGSDRFEEKAERLKQVLADIKAKGLNVKEIDLDYGDRAFVKLKSVT